MFGEPLDDTQVRVELDRGILLRVQTGVELTRSLPRRSEAVEAICGQPGCPEYAPSSRSMVAKPNEAQARPMTAPRRFGSHRPRADSIIPGPKSQCSALLPAKCFAFRPLKSRS